MNKFFSALALGALLVLVAACSDQAAPLPTAVDTAEEAQLSAAKHGGNGFGAVFEEDVFRGLVNVDPEGDLCRARSTAPDEDLNSFIRTNPKGEQFLHINSKAAEILFITAGGDVYEGTGHLSINWHNLFAGDAPIQFSATGEVSDGAGNTLRAKCQFHSNANGDVSKDENELK